VSEIRHQALLTKDRIVQTSLVKEILAFKGGLAMNKDFGCCCGFLADMIMKYAPEIKDAYNIDTLQQCRVFFYYRKFIGSPPCKRWTYFITVCKRQECNFCHGLCT